MKKFLYLALLLSLVACGKRAEEDPRVIADQEAYVNRIKLKDWTCSAPQLTLAKSYFESCNSTTYQSSHCWDSAVASSCTKRTE
jgi:hypothetical protein